MRRAHHRCAEHTTVAPEHTTAHQRSPRPPTARLPGVRAAQGRAAEDAGGPHAAQPPVRPAQEVPPAPLRQHPRPDDRTQDDTAPQHAHTRPQRRRAAAPGRSQHSPPLPPPPLPTPHFPLGRPAVHKNLLLTTPNPLYSYSSLLLLLTTPTPTPPCPYPSLLLRWAVQKNLPTPSAPPHHLGRPAVQNNRAKRDATAAYADEARPTPNYPEPEPPSHRA